MAFSRTKDSMYLLFMMYFLGFKLEGHLVTNQKICLFPLKRSKPGLWNGINKDVENKCLRTWNNYLLIFFTTLWLQDFTLICNLQFMSCYLNMSTIYSTQHLSSVFQLWFEPIISKPDSNSLLTINIYLHDSASYIPRICYCPNYTKPPLLSVSQSSTLSTVYTHLSTYTSSCLSSLLHLYIWHPNPEREEVATPACPIASYLNMSL